MTQKTFLHNLRRGLGSAIIELKTNPNRTQYRDIVLRCCLKDIGYDIQCEGTKGYYLFTAICALGVKIDFEDYLINPFMKRLEHNLFQQLADILCSYVDNGSKKSQDALYAKYQSLIAQLSKQRKFPLKFCEQEQLEYLMICIVDNNKWLGFKKCVTDAGRVIMNRNDDACNSYDWFLCHSENMFGKERIAKYFDMASKKSVEVKTFVEAINGLKKVREENSRLRVESVVTLEDYVARAKQLERDQYAYSRMRISAMKFSRQSNQEDLLELVSRIVSEQSDEVRANLLQVFKDVDFPSDIGLLIKYSESGCNMLQDIAIAALARFSDHRVHELAIKFIATGNLDAGLPLLVKNWRKQDEPLIREHILSTKRVSHSLQQNLRDIYSKHRSYTCGDILEHIYRNGECTSCRSSIVKAMWKSRVLRDGIINECLYDSYDETRQFAKRLVSKQS